MLAHVLREGSWSAKQPPKEAIDGSFLVPEDSRLKAYLYPVRLLSFYLECESEPFLPIKYAIPIEATVSGYRGVLLLRDEANGELQLLSEEKPMLPSPGLALSLIKKSVFAGIAFEVEILAGQSSRLQ